MTALNKIGIYYAFWTRDWDADFVPFVSKVKRLGFDVLEVNAGTVTNMSNSERDRLKSAAKNEGIDLTFCIGLSREYDLTSDNTTVQKNGIAFLKKMAQMMKYMNAKTLGGIIYGSWPAKLAAGNSDKRPFVERSIKCMREAIKAAEDAQATFNVEVVNRFEQFVMNTAAEAVEYCRRVDSPNCKVLLDTFHLNIEEDNIGEAVAATADWLGHIHLGETNRRAPGRGRMPWDEFFGALGKANYRGALTMEPFLMPGGEVGRDISVYRDLRDGLDLDAEARRACDFTRTKLQQSMRS
jgi:D-psicose/D-tagatose/L-ribulose 3-epimerase